MLDALNAIVEFLNSIVSTVTESIMYIGQLFRFVGSALKPIYYVISLLPPYMVVFAVITVTLMIVLLFTGRSNNNG